MKKYKLLPILLAVTVTLAGCNVREALPPGPDASSSTSSSTSEPSSSSSSSSSTSSSSSAPTSSPTSEPTSSPTSEPTSSPTSEPTSSPTSDPTSGTSGTSTPQGPYVSFEEAVEFYKAQQIEVVIPNYYCESGSGQSSLNEGVLAYQIDSNTVEMEAFVSSMQDSGWALELQDGYYVGYYGNTDAIAGVRDASSQNPFVTVVFTVMPRASAEWPAEQIAADLALEGVSDVVPPFSGDAESYQYIDSSNQLGIYVGAGNEAAALAQYQSDLLAAGYSEAGLDSYGDMHYTSPNEEIDVCPWDGSAYGSAGYVIVDITVLGAVSEWPAEQIATDLEVAGVTDEIPPYSGSDASGFSYYSGSDGRQIAWIVEEGGELASIATYQADLLAAGYSENGLDDYGDMHYLSPSEELDVCAWNGADIGYPGYVLVDIEVLGSSQGSDVFPVEEMVEFFSYMYDLELDASDIPTYNGEAPKFVFDDSWSFFGLADVYVLDTTSEEVVQYVSDLVAAGWELYETKVYYADDDETIVDYTIYRVRFDAETAYAVLAIYDTVESDGYADIVLTSSDKPLVNWPTEDLALLCEENGTEEVIPAYVGNANGYYYSSYYQQVEILVDEGTEDDAVSLYAATLLAAGYVEAGEDDYGDMHYTSPEGAIDLCVYSGVKYDAPGYVIVDIVFNDLRPRVTSVEFSEALAIYNGQGYQVEIPNYSCESAAYSVQTNSSTALYVISYSSHEEMDAFALAMEEAGWVLTTDSYGDYNGVYGDNENVTVYIGDYIDYSYAGIVVQFKVVIPPSTEWPAAQIAADLALEGVTDVLPPFTGEANSYQYNEGSNKLLIEVGEGNEAEGLAQYQADLLAAGYTEGEADEFGDMHYISPDGQLDVCPWDGSLWGGDGYVVVDIAVLHGATETGIPLSEAEQFFASQGYSVDLPNFETELGSVVLQEPTGGLRYLFPGATHEEMDAYAALLEEQGWTVKMDSYGDYIAMLGDYGPRLYIADYIGYSYDSIIIECTIINPPVFPTEDINTWLESKGATESLPEYSGSGVKTFAFYNGQVYWYATSGDSTETIASYQADLLAAGWTEAGVDTYGDMHYTSPEGQLDVVVWNGADIGYTGYAFVDISVNSVVPPQPAIFPSEEIAEDLEAIGVTDTLPVYSGTDASNFNYYSGTDGRQLSWNVASGSETLSILSYQADLLAAGYTEAGLDQYGDMHYTSPNGELDVCAWNGADIGYSGYVLVDININDLGPKVSDTFPAEDAIAFFESKGVQVELADYVVESEDAYFESHSEYASSYGIYEIRVFGSNIEEMDEFAYQLSELGWILEPGDTEGDYVATYGDSLARLEIQDWNLSDYGCIRILFYMTVPELVEFPAEQVLEFYEGEGLVLPEDAFPAYESSNQDIVFEYDDSWYDFSGTVDVYIENTDHDEVLNYVLDLVGAGWTVDSYQFEWADEEQTELNAATYYLSFECEGDYNAQLVVFDWLVTNGYVDMVCGKVAKPLVTFPSEAIAEALGEDVTDVVPEFSGDALGYELSSTGLQLGILVEVGSEDETKAQYIADLLEAGYVEAGEDQYGDMHYTSPNGQIDVCPWTYASYPGYVIVNFKANDLSPRVTIELEEALELIEAVNPSVPFAGFETSSNATYVYTDKGSYIQYVFSGATHDDMDAFAATLAELGWTISIDNYGDYSGSYGSDAQIVIQDWIGYSQYDGILIQFAVYPPASAEFPSEDIAECLTGLGVTDTLPEFTGDATGYNFYGDYKELDILVEEGSESDSLGQYQADLLAAGYIEAGEDSYGDMHYTSPNGQLDVCPWIYSSYPGMVIVQFTVNEVVPPAGDNWSSDAQALMMDHFGDVLPYFEGEIAADWEYDADESEAYANFYGDVTASAVSALEAAGYTVYNPSTNYYEFAGDKILGYMLAYEFDTETHEMVTLVIIY